MNALSYSQLVGEHDRIEDLADAILRMSAAPISDWKKVSTALSELAQLVAHHLANEDPLIYPGIAKAEGQRITAQLDVLKHDWIEYLREWTPDCVAADGDTFVSQTEEILARLKTHVRLESDLLYAGALQTGKISLR